MKKSAVSIITLFLLFAASCFAQKEMPGTRFGVKAGINIANVVIKSGAKSETENSIIGATGGFFATIPASKSFAVQPELLFSMLGFKIKDGNNSSTVASNYLVLPVLAKYIFSNSGFAVYAGPQIGYLLSAKGKGNGQTESIKDDFNSTDVAGIFGADYTFPAGFNLSGRYQLGLADVGKGTQSGESIKNNAITFTVGYRFK